MPAGATAYRVALFRRGNQDCFVRVFCQFWFLWVDALLVVFRRAKKIRSLLRLRLTSAYRRCSPACSAHPSFFFTPSLIARSWRGTGSRTPFRRAHGLVASLPRLSPRGDNGLGLFAFGSHPKTNITSRFTRTPCKPAEVARAGFGVIL